MHAAARGARRSTRSAHGAHAARSAAPEPAAGATSRAPASARPAARPPPRRAGAPRAHRGGRVVGGEHLERRVQRRRQRAEVVAALEHEPERDAELVGQRRTLAAIAAKPAAVHAQLGERVVGVRVEAGRDEHELRRVRAAERHDDVLDERRTRRRRPSRPAPAG